MNNIDKWLAGLMIAGTFISVGIAWNSLSNRIDKVDDKITAIQRTLGSTTCNAILTRQMEAIDKNKASVRKALDDLSKQYDCGPHEAVVLVPDFHEENAVMTAGATASDTQLNAQLNAVDAQLKKKD